MRPTSPPPFTKKGLAAGPPSSLRFCEWGKAAGGRALRGAALGAGGGPGLQGGHPMGPPTSMGHSHVARAHTRTNQPPQGTRSRSCAFSLCPLARVALRHDSR